MRKPLVVDLFCGLGGWTEAFLAEGWEAWGFDIERHDYGSGGYPGQLVLQDVCTLHGAQLVDADALVASSPCQEFSYRAQPWKIAKAKAPSEIGLAVPEWWTKSEGDMSIGELDEWKAWKTCFPVDPPVLGINLFWQAFRIQWEIFEACGRWVPLVAENVRGTQPWVGRAVFNYGSFYLWGDIPPLMPWPQRSRKNDELGGGSWFNIGGPSQTVTGMNPDGRKVAVNFHEYEKTGKSGRSFQSVAVEGLKAPTGKGWFGENNSHNLMRIGNSNSNSRKTASAMIAKIPQPLASHIARIYKPETMELCFSTANHAER